MNKPQTPRHIIQERQAILEQHIHRSYSPYSRFRVAAYIETVGGEVFQGVNVENSSYSLTVCAETSAITQMIAAVGNQAIHDILIISDGDKPCPPCGACLQRLIEFGNQDTMVHLSYVGATTIDSYKLSDLMPLQFDRSFL